MAEMTVDLVAVERKMWSGQAKFVEARTTEGEIGILPGHAPLLGELAEGAGSSPASGSSVQDGDRTAVRCERK